MELVYRIQLNIMAFVFLGFVLSLSKSRLDNRDTLNKLFLLTGLVVLVELAVETLSCILNGVYSPFNIVFNNILSILLFIIAPILSFSFLLFIHKVIMPYHKISKVIMLICTVPLFINAILSMISPFTGWFFLIDSMNVYHRGSLFLAAASGTYIYLIIGFGYIIYHRNRILKQDFILLLIIGLLPIIGGIFQSIFYGLLMMWSSAAFALILAFIFLQERMVHIDSLTNTWSRESFYFVFERRIKQFKDRHFGAIYLDVDHLKEINDHFGHEEGDRAIKQLIAIVRKAITLNDTIARIGGDEFIVIIECREMLELEKVVSNIRQALKVHNSKPHQYILGCSMGSEMFSEAYSDMDDFIHVIDLLMYIDKNQRNIT